MAIGTVQAVTDTAESVTIKEETKETLKEKPKEESKGHLISEQRGKLKGKVKWFNNAKGYGFIIADPIPGNLNDSSSTPPNTPSNDDMFAHFSSINMEGYKSLKSGQSVLFDAKQVDNGIHAVNISTFEDTDEQKCTD